MTRREWAKTMAAAAAAGTVTAGDAATAQPRAGMPDPVATFSILGFDPATGEVGGAVQSRVFSVGNGVLWAEAGVGEHIDASSYLPAAVEALLECQRRMDAPRDQRLAFCERMKKKLEFHPVAEVINDTIKDLKQP